MCRWRSVLNYLAGPVYGDGSLYYYRRNNEYFIHVYDQDQEFLQRVGVEVSKALKVRYTIIKPSKNANYYRLQFTSKKIYSYVAKLVKEKPQRLTKNFIRGIIDAEGTVYADKKGRVAFELGIANQRLAIKISNWLEKRGIRATCTLHKDRRPHRRTIAKVRVRGWENVDKMFKLVKPMHPKLVVKFENLKMKHSRARPATPP